MTTVTATVLALRPGPVPSSPPSPPSGPVVPVPMVEWDGVRGLHTAHCPRCTDTYTSTRFDLADRWADRHRCDAELLALLAEIIGRAA